MANEYRLKFTLSDGNTIDAGKIVVPEGAKGDKGDKGDPYTLTSTDKAAIVQDVLAALPYYDGSVTISGGVELISFSVTTDSGTIVGEYQAEAGMSWSEFVSSEYNTGGYEVWSSNGYVYTSFGTNVFLSGVAVKGVDTIVADASYIRGEMTSG